jgi:hypothetical protein
MKRKAFLLVVLSAFFFTAQSQDIGSMMTELAKGIKPEAFKGSFLKNQDDWLKKAGDLKMTDLSGASSQLASLVKGLKPAAFSGDAKGLKKDLLANLFNAGDPKKLLESVGSLVKGLDPSMLASGFNKDSFLKGLTGLM